MEKKYVILGGGPAGTFAAQKIRLKDKDALITIITEESYPMYARPRLPDYIAGKIELDDLIIFKESWYKSNNVDLKLNSMVSSISFEQKDMELEGGEFVVYDKLLFATGGKPFIPHLDIYDSSKVFILRTIEDAVALKKITMVARDIAIIGGGILGLEAACSFLKSGVEVKILEHADRLMSRQLDEEGSAILKNKIESMGIKFFLNADIKEINSRGLKLKDSGDVDADVVLISAGIVPAVDMARQAGLKVNRGIIVDENMQASHSDVYAAGDCCEYNGITYGLWGPAKEQGECAALNMLGEKTEYKGSSMLSTTKVVGIDIACCGNLKVALETPGVKNFKEKNDEKYFSLYVKDGKAIAGVFVGNTQKVIAFKQFLATNQDITNKENEIIKEFF